MRNWIDLFESSSVYYHGSYDRLQVGTIMSGRGAQYADAWQHTGFYPVLERYRPQGLLAHHEGVFMCDNPDDLDACGGGTDWVFTLRALGPVQRHDLNWGSAISSGVDEEMPEEQLAELARRYWSGEPSRDPLWEYLTASAEIIAVEEF